MMNKIIALTIFVYAISFAYALFSRVIKRMKGGKLKSSEKEMEYFILRMFEASMVCTLVTLIDANPLVVVRDYLLPMLFVSILVIAINLWLFLFVSSIGRLIAKSSRKSKRPKEVVYKLEDDDVDL